MKNKVLIIISIIFISCITSKTTLRNELIFKGPISSNPNPEFVSIENRKAKDSLDFTVIKGKYLSGTRHVEILWKNNIKLYYWKRFYPNKKIKEKGTMTADNRICVGQWEFYSKEGKIDSIIDYDKKNKISYFKALEIAKEYDLEMPSLEIDFINKENSSFWQIRKWNMKNGSGTSETILIDSKKGTVQKPDNEVIKYY
ncbi:hypothetical protein [Psychroserpens burtonensis]|uniref:hypothetical protein n=1 Tax=Psychroserpens burtonensis TaxID=49278 RepID=UPI00042830D7|nr:hypothetical protein [Psychroserpens burtonensis]